MTKTLLSMLALAFFLAAGNSAIAQQQFGAPVSSSGAITYDKMLTRMKTVEDSLNIKVVGTVEEVCQMKGCWMNMTSNNAKKPKMVVKFKDYAFFVPKDIAGRKVVIEGVAYREVTSVEELRHLAEDAGKSAAEIKAITQPKEELKFMASGVLLLD